MEKSLKRIINFIIEYEHSSSVSHATVEVTQLDGIMLRTPLVGRQSVYIRLWKLLGSSKLEINLWGSWWNHISVGSCKLNGKPYIVVYHYFVSKSSFFIFVGDVLVSHHLIEHVEFRNDEPLKGFFLYNGIGKWWKWFLIWLIMLQLFNVVGLNQ